jgi:hypothetical protein
MTSTTYPAEGIQEHGIKRSQLASIDPQLLVKFESLPKKEVIDVKENSPINILDHSKNPKKANSIS